jgi:hypothetical protein
METPSTAKKESSELSSAANVLESDIAQNLMEKTAKTEVGDSAESSDAGFLAQ